MEDIIIKLKERIMIPFKTFAKRYFTYRVSDLTKVTKLSEIKELPTGVILHSADNFAHSETSLVPRLTHKLYNLRSEKIYLYHAQDSSKIEIPFVTDKISKYQLIDIGLHRALTNFRTANIKRIRTVDDILAMPAKNNTLNVVSYNSLFRAKMRGLNIKHERVKHVFAHMIDTILSINKREHFIHIPISSPTLYEKEDFNRAFKKHDRASLKFSEDYLYLVLVQLLCYLNKESNQGILRHLPVGSEREITFVFTSNNKAIFYNLGQLLELNGDQNKILRKVTNHVNMVTRELLAAPSETLLKPIQKDLLELKEGVSHNHPYIEAPATEAVTKQRYAKTTQEIDTDAARLIDGMHKKTPKQKRHLARKASAYKSIMVGDKTIEAILTDHTNQNLSDNGLNFLEPLVFDKSMLQSNVFDFDAQYMEKTFRRDLVSVLTDFNKHGMFLTDVTEKVIDTEHHKVTNYKATFEDTDFTKHIVRFTLPIPDKDGIMTLNGAKKSLKKQRVNRPICKVSPVRVTLNASFNKSIVERKVTMANSFRVHLSKLIGQAGQKVIIEYGKVPRSDRVLPYEYTTSADVYRSFSINGFKFNFNYAERMKGTPADHVPILEELEKEYGVYVGTFPSAKASYFMKLSGEFTGIILKNKEVIESTTMIGKIATLLDVKPKQLNEWVELKILNKSVPVIFALCYQYGLSAMIKYLELEHEIYDTGAHIPYDPTMIRVKFRDKTLVFKRTPFAKSLIFSGLNSYKLTTHHIADMDGKDVYSTLMQSKRLSLNYLKGIDSFFQLFLDAITVDVLAQMNEPTNVRDLLIRATSLLTTTEHPPASAEVNFRYRSFERFPATISNELSRGFATWTHEAVGHKEKFSINPKAVYLRIIKDQLTDNVDINNPIHDIKRRTAFSHMGDGGRSRDSLVIKDRRFAKDSTGTISESTIDGPTVGINAYLTMDPSIINTRGLGIPKEFKDIKPTELLSISGLLIPAITHDDSKRSSFANGQLSQYIPTKEGTPSRLRTGYEHVVAHRTGLPFSYVAEEDGKITEINEELKMIKIVYKSGKVKTVQYGEEYSNNAGAGFYVTQRLELNNFKKGEKVKQGDVVVYNKEYFQAEQSNKQVAWKMGVATNVVLWEEDGTYEDSCIISRDLSRKLSFSPTHVRNIVIDKDTIIHQTVAIGTELKSIDPLLIFDTGKIPEALSEKTDEVGASILQALNQSSPRAKYNGTVTKIEAFYKCPVKEMSPSLAKLVKVATKLKNARAKFSENSSDKDFHAAVPIELDRLGNIIMEADTVMLRVYITQDMTARAGDKLHFSASSKSVPGAVMNSALETEDGSVKIDARFSSLAVANRIVLSPIISGITNRILERMETDILAIWDE